MRFAMRTSAATLLVPLMFAAGCERATTPASTATVPTPKPHAASAMSAVAGIQDIMAYMIDPAADFLWESVSTNVTNAGVEEKQPHTDAEWNEVRRQAIILTEAANLILMEGRHVARDGKELEDHGTAGNLTAAQSEQAIISDHAAFESFATALRDVGKAMLAAADERKPAEILNAGDTMDQVCEGCHLKFWYPGQRIPAFPGQAPEEK